MKSLIRILVITAGLCMILASYSFAADNQMGRGNQGNMGMMNKGAMQGGGNAKVMMHSTGMGKWGNTNFEQNFRRELTFITVHAVELELTDSQVGKIKELQYNLNKEMIAQKSQIASLDLDIRHELEKDNMDPTVVNRLIDKKYEAKKQEDKDFAEAYSNLHSILTQEQENKLKVIWSNYMEDRNRRMRLYGGYNYDEDIMRGRMMRDHEGDVYNMRNSQMMDRRERMNRMYDDMYGGMMDEDEGMDNDREEMDEDYR